MNSSYWNGKNVIVSGGTGFIGSHFIEELAGLGANVIGLHRSGIDGASEFENVTYVQIDALDGKELDAICRSVKADAFIHCAAIDGNTQFKIDNAAEILDVNSRLVSNVLNSCKNENVRNIALMSSAEVYMPDTPSPIVEDYDYHQYLAFTSNGYVLSKVFSEILAELYGKQHGLSVYTPRPTNVYGPRDSFGSTTNRVIPAMIQKVSNGKEIEIWGDGKQTRSFIYVKDLVHTTLSAISKGETGPINMATKEQVSILELAEYISKMYNAENLIKIDTSKPAGVKSRQLDVSRMYGVIDFEPLDIQRGLEYTVSWYESSHNKPTR